MDMVSPQAFHAASCDANEIDSHPKPSGTTTSADATDVSTATKTRHTASTAKVAATSAIARFGGREQA